MEQICKDEPIPRDDLARNGLHRLIEHRPIISESMKLAPLSAGIYVRWKLFEQPLVKLASGKAGRELLRIDASQTRAQPARDHPARQHAGGYAPQRKQRINACAREFRLAILT